MSEHPPTLCVTGWRMRMRYLADGIDPNSARIYMAVLSQHMAECDQCRAWRDWMDASAQQAVYPDDSNNF